MGDNTTLNPGEGGDVINTDETSAGVKTQVNKVGYGPDGELTLVSSENGLPTTLGAEAADGGAAPSRVLVLGGYDGSAVQRLNTDASGFLQVDINDDPSKAVLEAVKALLETIDTDTGNIATSTGTLDNAIAGSEMQVDVVSGGPLTTAVEALIAGATIFRSLDIDETEEEVKGTAGRLLFYHYANRTAEELFLKFYNATAANVTVGSTTPVLTIPLAKESQGHVAIPKGGWIFSTAISVACVKGVADANAEGPAANGCVINLGYA